MLTGPMSSGGRARPDVFCRVPSSNSEGRGPSLSWSDVVQWSSAPSLPPLRAARGCVRGTGALRFRFAASCLSLDRLAFVISLLGLDVRSTLSRAPRASNVSVVLFGAWRPVSVFRLTSVYELEDVPIPVPFTKIAKPARGDGDRRDFEHPTAQSQYRRWPQECHSDLRPRTRRISHRSLACHADSPTVPSFGGDYSTIPDGIVWMAGHVASLNVDCHHAQPCLEDPRSFGGCRMFAVIACSVLAKSWLRHERDLLWGAGMVYGTVRKLSDRSLSQMSNLFLEKPVAMSFELIQ